MSYVIGTGARQDLEITAGSSVDWSFTVAVFDASETVVTIRAEDGAGNATESQVTVIYVAPGYRLRLSGARSSAVMFANGVDESGVVVGEILGEDLSQQAFRWGTDGVTILPLPSGFVAGVATGISAQGLIVGGGDQDAGGYRAVRWVDGSVETLDHGSYEGTFATGVNADETVIGWADMDPALWVDGALQVPEGFPAGGRPKDISANGYVAGETHSGVFRWKDGLHEMLPGLGTTDPCDGHQCGALGVNKDGEVVGAAAHPDSAYPVPVLWTDQAVMLQRPAGYPMGLARAINDSGVVVGMVTKGGQERVAVLWCQHDVYVLQTLIADSSVWLPEAWAINEAGQIAGHAFLGSGQQQAFLATPADPPADCIP